ncbi:MAG: hypothetical protein JNL32_01240 [Candidatus Kapabacteria bacterium]|nr:hypothetical protein [Candidatus Kapabacteria bacterium]
MRQFLSIFVVISLAIVVAQSQSADTLSLSPRLASKRIDKSTIKYFELFPELENAQNAVLLAHTSDSVRFYVQYTGGDTVLTLTTTVLQNIRAVMDVFEQLTIDNVSFIQSETFRYIMPRTFSQNAVRITLNLIDSSTFTGTVLCHSPTTITMMKDTGAYSWKDAIVRCTTFDYSAIRSWSKDKSVNIPAGITAAYMLSEFAMPNPYSSGGSIISATPIRMLTAALLSGIGIAHEINRSTVAYTHGRKEGFQDILSYCSNDVIFPPTSDLPPELSTLTLRSAIGGTITAQSIRDSAQYIRRILMPYSWCIAVNSPIAYSPSVIRNQTRQTYNVGAGAIVEQDLNQRIIADVEVLRILGNNTLKVGAGFQYASASSTTNDESLQQVRQMTLKLIGEYALVSSNTDTRRVFDLNIGGALGYAMYGQSSSGYRVTNQYESIDSSFTVPDAGSNTLNAEARLAAEYFLYNGLSLSLRTSVVLPFEETSFEQRFTVNLTRVGRQYGYVTRTNTPSLQVAALVGLRWYL